MEFSGIHMDANALWHILIDIVPNELLGSFLWVFATDHMSRERILVDSLGIRLQCPGAHRAHLIIRGGGTPPGGGGGGSPAGLLTRSAPASRSTG